MKSKSLLMIIMFISNVSIINAQNWSQLFPPYSYVVNSCWIDDTSPDNGWFIGWRLAGADPVSYGYKTTDGGSSFTFMMFSYYFWLAQDVYFTNSNNGVMVGSGIIQTVNGGETWNVVVDNISMAGWMYDVMFADPNNGYSVGKTYDNSYTSYWGVIYKTTNGGGSWTNSTITYETLNQNTEFRAVHSTGAGVIYAGGLNTIGSSSLFKSTDNGSSWSALNFFNDVNSLWFASPDTGYAATNLGIFKTTNAGVTWSNVLTTSQALYSLTIKNQFGFAVGQNGLIYSTTDRGLSWTLMTSPVTNQDLLKVFVVSNTLAYAVGTSGTILKYQNVIPVEMVSLSAISEGSTITLNWSTKTETNNMGFEIERASSSIVPTQDWNKIGFVEGNGTTTEPKSYSFVDDNLPAGRQGLTSGKYYYRLKQTDFDGTFKYSNVIEVLVSVPLEFSLLQNYPNPFNGFTIISWQQPVSGVTSLKIYDVLGNEVATLINQNVEAGKHSINFNASDLTSGMYIYKLQSNNLVETKKLVLLK